VSNQRGAISHSQVNFDKLLNPHPLRMEALDSFLWSDSNHISVKRLWECLTQYPYLRFLVKPAIAQKQLDAELVPQEKAIASRNNGKTTGTVREAKAKIYPSSSDCAARTLRDQSLEEQGVGATPVLRRFYGNIEIDAVRVNRDFPAIANEVIQHLTSLNGSNVKVTLEIEAENPDFSETVGFPDEIVRTVTENCRTLKFKTQEFEE